MKENLKPYVYKQIEHCGVTPCDIVPFVEWAGELRGVARLSNLNCGAEAKASLKMAKVA